MIAAKARRSQPRAMQPRDALAFLVAIHAEQRRPPFKGSRVRVDNPIDDAWWPSQVPAVSRKHCRICGETLAAACFDTKRHSLDGLASGCKPCTKREMKERRAARRRLTSSGLAHGPLPPEKQCFTCGRVRGRSEYHRDAKALDGLQRTCAACSKDASKQRWLEARAQRRPITGVL